MGRISALYISEHRILFSILKFAIMSEALNNVARGDTIRPECLKPTRSQLSAPPPWLGMEQGSLLQVLC